MKLPCSAIDVFFCIFLFLLYFTASGRCQDASLNFEHFSINDGLSQNAVHAIIQDHRGFLWIGTQDGLNRYDGYSFRVYKHRHHDTNSLSGNTIWALIEDSRKTLWISVWGHGVNYYRGDEGRFIRMQNQPGKETAPASNYITSICEDGDGKIWMGHLEKGIDVYDPENNVFTHYGPEEIFQDTLSSGYITGLFRDSRERLWIGTSRGILILFDAFNKKFLRFPLSGASLSGTDRNLITAIAEDPSGILWLATSAGGLTLFHPDSRIVIRNHDAIIPSTPLFGKNITAVFLSRTNRLWAGSFDQGLVYAELGRKSIRHLIHTDNDPGSLANNQVKCIYEDRTGMIWIGTKNGLDKLNPHQMQFTVFKKQPSQKPTLSHSIALSVYAESNPKNPAAVKVWIGTPGGGLNLYDYAKESWTHYRHNPKDPFSIGSDRIYAILKDKHGSLWLGTSKGLNEWKEETGRFIRYPYDPLSVNSISGNFVHALIEDPDPSVSLIWLATQHGVCSYDAKNRVFTKYDDAGKRTVKSGSKNLTALAAVYDTLQKATVLWMGTYGDGLIRFIPSAQSKTYYRFSNEDSVSISNDFINHVHVTSGGIVWAGTQYGLNRLNPGTSRFRRYTSQNGFPNDMINGIKEDASGRLWISTNNGLCRFEPSTETLVVFGQNDGLPSNEFAAGACYRSDNGQMYFGGINGAVAFFPDSVKADDHQPSAVITGMKIFHRPVFPIPPVEYGESVTLSHDDYVFAFEISALDYAAPKKNQYAYKLEGVDPAWINLGNERTISFTRMEPGAYRLLIRASDHHGQWNEKVTVFTFEITPPFWKSTWFRALVIAGFVLILSGFYKYRMRTIREQNRKLEEVVEERTRALVIKTNLLERIDTMVKSINSEMNFSNLLDTILQQLRMIRGYQKALILVHQPADERYHVYAHAGWEGSDMHRVSFAGEEITGALLRPAQERYPDVFTLNRHAESYPVFNQLGQPLSVLTVPVRIEKNTGGYLILTNALHREAFQDEDLQVILSIKEHIAYAFIKTRLLEDLKLLNEKKNEFLGIAAHDLRNPLTSIIGYTDLIVSLIREEQYTFEQGLKDLSKISNSAQQMARLVEELLDISSIESGKVRLELERTGIMSIVSECEQYYKRAAEQKKIRFTVIYHPVMPSVLIDRVRITEVIDNLLSNAIKYTHEGGTVRVYPELENGSVILHVQDTGQGLNEDDMAHVFSSFKRLSSRPTGGETSTGLGLAIVKKIVELHGGRVWVNSQKGEGSTFSFLLPVAN